MEEITRRLSADNTPTQLRNCTAHEDLFWHNRGSIPEDLEKPAKEGEKIPTIKEDPPTPGLKSSLEMEGIKDIFGEEDTPYSNEKISIGEGTIPTSNGHEKS